MYEPNQNPDEPNAGYFSNPNCQRFSEISQQDTEDADSELRSLIADIKEELGIND